MKKRLKKIYKEFRDILRKPEMRILPGQIAFYFLMSLIPIIAIIAFLASLAWQNFNLESLIRSNMPNVFSDILIGLIKGASYSSGLLIVLISYLILGSNGPSSIIIASNALYKVKQPNFLKTKIKSIVMIFVIILLLIFMIFVPILGDTLAKLILKILHKPDWILKLAVVYNFLKTLFSFIVIFLFVKVLYTMAPDKKIKSRETTIGAAFTTISWIILTDIFQFYIINIAKYNQLYGNFANILILLMWIYFLAYLFVIGMALNINAHQEKLNAEKLGSGT